MRTVRALFVLSVLTVASFQAKAQAFSAIDVHLPYSILAGEHRLSPGEYVIRPLPGVRNVFAVYKDGGMVFETLVQAMPAEKLDPAPKTELVLRSDGREYVLDAMWIEGMGAGYQFMRPESVKSRERERRMTEVIGRKIS